jgi:hypothetical protein
MAIAVILDFPGGTLERYDQVTGRILDAMGVKPGATPPGGIFHWVAGTDDGIRIVDVWETREHFDRWVFGLEEMGRPQITFYDVHNIRAGTSGNGATA